MPMIAPLSRQLAVAFDPLGQAEIRDVRLAVLVEQDVGRLEVAVQDAPLVCVVHRLGGRFSSRAADFGSAVYSAELLVQARPPISFMLK